MEDVLTSPAAFANPPLTADRLEEIKTGIDVLGAALLEEHHPQAARKLMEMVNDLVREVERADGLMLSLLGVALADCTEDNHVLREALMRRQKP